MTKLFFYIAALIFLAGCSTLPNNTTSTGALSFLPAQESSRKLIVFVHGVFGNPDSSWTNKTGISWPDLIKDDTKFQDFTVATYRYDSPFLQRSSGIEEITQRLLRQLEDQNIFGKFHEVYFIAHSMGGLVVKGVLVNLNRPSQIDKLRTVKAVLYISTPAQGATLAEVSAWLGANPQLRDMEPADLNSFLQALENQWQNLFRDRGAPPFPQSFCAYETKPINGIHIVNRIYATTYCDQNPFPVDEDHFGIAKPSNKESDIYLWARSQILNTSALAQSQRLLYSLRKTPYRYQPGLIVEGVEWRDNYREYEFVVRNPSTSEQVVDLRLRFAFPWPVIDSRLISQEGCQSLVFTGIEDGSLKVESKGQITNLQNSWTNVLNISATMMFPEAVFRGKVIMDTESTPIDFANLTAHYRDGTGVTKKSFYHRISVLDAAAGKVTINPEPLKGEQKIGIMFQFKEPIEFKK